MGIVLALFCLFSIACYPFSKTWHLGGDVSIQFESDAPFQCSEDEMLQFGAHLPGFNEDKSPTDRSLHIEHHYFAGGSAMQLTQKNGAIEIVSNWKGKFPPDLIHLLYGAARVEWLKERIFPVHAACIGNDRDGYILFMGPPGSGKTSLTLSCASKNGDLIFSGDKTLLRWNEAGELEAIAGTHTMTIRSEDIPRWTSLPKAFEVPFGDRLAFQLSPECYAQKRAAAIRQIFLITLNDGVEAISQLSPLSALHTLYPFFMDKQREDVLLEGGQAFFDGSVSQEIRMELAKCLSASLEKIPVYKVVASLERTRSFISEKHLQQTPRKILFGVCGIGNGHCLRQLPLLQHLLSQGHQILIFTYGEGLSFFKEKFPSEPRLTVIPVADPYYVGTPQGLDFKQTALLEKNKIDFNQINALAIDRVMQEFETCDLVISDYEMVAAQYAYAKDIPLVTLDQQSKYLACDFLPSLNGTSYLDEKERLRLFFPKAEKRIAISFFNVPNPHQTKDFQVEILPPILRPEVIQAKNFPLSPKPSLLVYASAQQFDRLSMEQWIASLTLALPENFEAHLFLPRHCELPPNKNSLFFYHHGDDRFDSILFACHGIVSTAGHTLLSEAMYLGKPVYAIPLPLYEQQLNAHIIAQGEFGLSADHLSESDLRTFLAHLDDYAKKIREDRFFLLKEPGNDRVLKMIDSMLRK